jgi:outer membrane protein OmpA-like peptidoglycan-associated protein
MMSFLGAVIVAFALTSCSASRTTKGGAIGTGVGGAVGGIIGSQSGNTAEGAIIGAMIGGTAGALIGKYMDRQAEQLMEELEGAEVERIGEGIKITFDSGILFDVDSDELREESKANLEELADVLREYEGTNVLIEGHTDSTGDEEYNMNLSEERAGSVVDYLRFLDVDRKRLIAEGYGEAQPVASNESSTGRQKNRRVEIAIYANDRLKRDAEKGELSQTNMQ